MHLVGDIRQKTAWRIFLFNSSVGFAEICFLTSDFIMYLTILVFRLIQCRFLFLPSQFYAHCFSHLEFMRHKGLEKASDTNRSKGCYFKWVFSVVVKMLKPHIRVLGF